MEFAKILEIIIKICNIRFKIWYRIKKFIYKVKYEIDEDTVEEIIKICNNKEYNKKNLYRILELYLLKCSCNPNVLSKAREFGEDVKAKHLGNTIVISTSNQYKMASFIMFIDAKNNKIILAEDNIGDGIVSVRLLKTPSEFNAKLLEVKYLHGNGTGFTAHNIRLFLVLEKEVFLVLDKTVFETVSGWKAFKGNDTAEFEQKYSLDWKDDTLQLILEGRICANNKVKKLPLEKYVYDELIRSFRQIEGRAVENHLLSEVYGDLAQAKGDWFVKPQEIKENYSLYATW